MKLEEVLLKTNEIINIYESGEWVTPIKLGELLRTLTWCHYRITDINIQAGRDWNKEVYKFKGSDAAGQRFADLTVPELRMTRKLLTTISKAMDSMRSEIGILKKEQ